MNDYKRNANTYLLLDAWAKQKISAQVIHDYISELVEKAGQTLSNKRAQNENEVASNIANFFSEFDRDAVSRCETAAVLGYRKGLETATVNCEPSTESIDRLLAELLVGEEDKRYCTWNRQEVKKWFSNMVKAGAP